MAAPQILLKPVHPEIDDGNPITQGLVFDAPFFEGAGQFVSDDATVLEDLLGTITGATWDRNFYGIDLDFSAASSVVTFTTPASINSLTKFSVEFLAYTRGGGSSTNGRWLYKGNNPYWMIFYNAGIGIRTFYATTNGDWQYTGGAFTLNAWHHIIVTLDASNAANNPLLYVDGVSVTPTVLTNGVGARNADDTNFEIGNNNLGTREINGKISYSRVWNRILTPGEVWALYTNPWRIYVRPNFIPYYNSNPVAAAVTPTFGTPRLLMGMGT